MTSQVFPARFASPSGLTVEVNANGSIRRIDHRDVILNLFLGNEIEGGPANVYLRRRAASIESVPLQAMCAAACAGVSRSLLMAWIIGSRL
jgi:hypothetical protein